MTCKDVLADVNECKQVSERNLLYHHKNLQIPETYTESSRKRPSSIVYNFSRLRESILASEQL